MTNRFLDLLEIRENKNGNCQSDGADNVPDQVNVALSLHTGRINVQLRAGIIGRFAPGAVCKTLSSHVFCKKATKLKTIPLLCWPLLNISKTHRCIK